MTGFLSIFWNVPFRYIEKGYFKTCTKMKSLFMENNLLDSSYNHDLSGLENLISININKNTLGTYDLMKSCSFLQLETLHMDEIGLTEFNFHGESVWG